MAAFWVPNSSVTKCKTCPKVFGLFIKKHHCRLCGQIFCDTCTSHTLLLSPTEALSKPGKMLNFSSPERKPCRVCSACWELNKDKVQPTVLPVVRQIVDSAPIISLQQDQFYQHPNIALNQAHSPSSSVSELTPIQPTSVCPPPICEYFDGPAPPVPGTLPSFPNTYDNFDVRNNHLTETLKTLQTLHLPHGLNGFLLVEPTKPESIAGICGLSLYDLIFACENNMFSPDMDMAHFRAQLRQNFIAKGSCQISVYSFTAQKYRRITIFPPPGNPNVMLGIVCSRIPIPKPPAPTPAPGLLTDQRELHVKAWKKQGDNFICISKEMVPLYENLTPYNQDLYTKVFRYENGMWAGCGFHPIYNYTTLREHLYVEVWSLKSGVLMRDGGDFAALPVSR